MLDDNQRSEVSAESLLRVALRHAVAERHDAAQVGRHSLRLPRVSGDECARALERCGLVRSDESAGVIWMEAGATFFCVPRCHAVPAETVLDILAGSGVPVGSFIEELARTARGSERRSSPDSRAEATAS